MPAVMRNWPLPLALVTIATISGTWYKFVSEIVPDPYLDEVFHVPQAQRYCKKDYTWDPKITTPPGLQAYVLSLLVNVFTGDCSTASLRGLNIGAICLVCLVAYGTLRTLNRRSSNRQEQSKVGDVTLQTTVEERNLLMDAHSALNISLFSPLFFFSGLYYTDVVSTLVVLLSYNVFLKSSTGTRTIWKEAFLVFLGVAALSFRQTNIFWVAVFPAGLALVETLKNCQEPTLNTNNDTWSILKNSWSHGYVFDVSVQEGSPSDYILFLLSIALAALGKPIIVLRVVLPYVALVGLFAGFVVWNGGVVLGDKSNHVATIHVPQMLYLWPYIIFFSIPLIVASLSRPLVRLLPEKPLKTFLQDNLVGSFNVSAPGLISISIFVTLGLAAVHLNTIVHPFTLADNRHYIFYIFRILRRNSVIKYLAVPFYYACAWMAIQTLGSPTQERTEMQRDHKKHYPIDQKADCKPCHISFVTVWLATTTLSVITAPLVEPRYFIIPWIIWRLHVPNIGASLSSKRSIGKVSYDLRLILETAWLLAVNAIIAYNFLYRGFSWPNEPGKTQRFLW